MMNAPPAADPRPLILTARLDTAAAAGFEALRRAHYPPARNQVPAHVSLFHQLPGSSYPALVSRLIALARTQPPITAEILPPRLTGNGVAYDLRSAELGDLHAELAQGWATLLIAQDQVRLRAHITVQNKVSAEQARATLALLAATPVPARLHITGVTIWRYLDGPWQHLRDIGFRSAR